MASAEAILETLANKGVSGKLLAWIRDFLTHRQARVSFQGKLSNNRTFENGTPQGSILSPFLFNILMENLVPLQFGASTKILCYADDIVIISTGPRMNQKTQEALTTMSNKCEELGLKINHNKTKAMVFGTKPQPPLKISGTDVGWTNPIHT